MKSPRHGRTGWQTDGAVNLAAPRSSSTGPIALRLAPVQSRPSRPLGAAKVELENRQKVAAPKVEALYAALSEGKWPQILSAAEAVLTSVPEHPAARQARSRAWQQIAAIGPAAARWPQRAARGRGTAADRSSRRRIPTPSLLSRNHARSRPKESSG